MPKCTINDKNEITMFWGDSNPSTPSDALDCDVLKTINAIGSPENQTYLYKLVDGKVTPTDAGEDYDAKQYQRDRQYPALGEQLDMLFHDMTSSKGDKTGEWYKAIAKVKADNPKE